MTACHMKCEENDQVYMFLAGVYQSPDELKGLIVGRKPLPYMKSVFGGETGGEQKVNHAKTIFSANPSVSVLDMIILWSKYLCINLIHLSCLSCHFCGRHVLVLMSSSSHH